MTQGFHFSNNTTTATSGTTGLYIYTCSEPRPAVVRPREDVSLSHYLPPPKTVRQRIHHARLDFEHWLWGGGELRKRIAKALPLFVSDVDGAYLKRMVRKHGRDPRKWPSAVPIESPSTEESE